MVSAAAIASNCCVLKQQQVNNSFVGGCSLKRSCSFSHLLKPSKKSSRLVVASSGSTKLTQHTGRFYINITGFPFPLGPFLNRRTIRTEVSLKFITAQLPIFRNAPSESFHLFAIFFFKVDLGMYQQY